MSFKINEYITLKYENWRTEIYVCGEKFRQCTFLLMNIPESEVQEEITSIDSAEELFDPGLEHPSKLSRVPMLSPKQEFWAHCSNIQAWVENDYDTRLLHRSLAFPLLKRLKEEGDPLASKRFKEEIYNRLNEGNATVCEFLLRERYLDDFTIEDLLRAAQAVRSPEKDFELDIELYVYKILKRAYWKHEFKDKREEIAFTKRTEPICMPRVKHYPKSFFDELRLKHLLFYLPSKAYFFGLLDEEGYDAILEIEKQVNKNFFISSDWGTPSITIDDDGSVCWLDLSDCKLKDYPTALNKLDFTNAEVISFSNNQLSKLPDFLTMKRFEGEDYLELSFDSNQISHLDFFPRLDTKYGIYLGNNPFKKLPELPEPNPSLALLSLAGNQLNTSDAFPDSLANLTEIEELILWGNELYFFPEVILRLESLDILKLTKNKLKQIPEDISNLINLRYLHLNDNQIQAIPKGFKKLINLREIFLDNNQLTEFPYFLKDLPKLDFLHLKGNPLEVKEEELQDFNCHIYLDELTYKPPYPRPFTPSI